MVAVRLPQHRHCAPRQNNNFRYRYNHLFFCGAWGCLIADYTTTLQNRITTTFCGLKKNKKECKFKFQFQKVKFEPYGFLKKSPPLQFQDNSLFLTINHLFQYNSWVVFFQKNLTLFETSTRRMAFFFFFFSKYLMQSVATASF